VFVIVYYMALLRELVVLNLTCYS